MSVKPIHDPKDGPLRTVALMSGSGTNVRRILEYGERLKQKEGKSPFQVAVIFSDRYDSQATRIGRDFDLPVLTRDLEGWMKQNNVTRKELDKREQFDRENVAMLKPFGAKVAIYGGYMSIASPTLVNAFLGVNVHPADLSAETLDGKRRWTGAHAVLDAIAAGEPTIASSTHLVGQEVDMGPLLMISRPLEVELENGADISEPNTLKRIADRNQDSLKECGDWVIFPQTIEAIARGWFQMDEKGNIYYKDQPAPKGIRPDIGPCKK